MTATRERPPVGQYLRDLRERAGLSGEEVARRTGVRYASSVFNFESGYHNLPAHHWPGYAQVLGVGERLFTLHMLRFYRPAIYRMVFGVAEPEAADRIIAEGTADV